MKIYSYVVARDYGFAPNPFHGFCTLATCKPLIRKQAKVGDFIVGLTPKSLGNKVCYAMEVAAKISFDEYWANELYQDKKPSFDRSYKFAAGDNIYHTLPDGTWHQQNSHHTHEDGRPIQENIMTDTGITDQVLIGYNYSYWGGEGLDLPPELSALKVARGHKCNFSQQLIDSFKIWHRSQDKGFLYAPERWNDRSTFR